MERGTEKLKIYSVRKQVDTKKEGRNISGKAGRSGVWPQSETGHWTGSAGTDCSCHCSARAWVPARTCQKLAVTLIYTEEPCCFLFSPNVPRDKLKSPPCFTRASWDGERESYTVAHPWLVPESWQLFTLVLRDYLSLCSFVLVLLKLSSLLLILFGKLYLGLVQCGNKNPLWGSIKCSSN